MKENYKILGQYIKDMSSETPDIETFLFVRDYISKYQLNIDITSKALKNIHVKQNYNKCINFNNRSNKLLYLSKKIILMMILFNRNIQLQLDEGPQCRREMFGADN